MNLISNATAALPLPDARRRVRVSVVIPTLNEATVLGRTLREIGGAQDIEIIVVDGGSCDSTVKIAERFGALVVMAHRGRAHQMNVGAAAAKGEVLVFLHADTRLPTDFARLIHETLRDPVVVAGAFRLRLDSPRYSVRLVERMANFRSRWLRLPYGDQALFVKRHVFRAAAGFARLPIMEDFEFVRRLARWGRIVIVPAEVVSSARRWERLGVLRTTLINQMMILGYAVGVSPSRLARWYRGAKPGRDRDSTMPGSSLCNSIPATDEQ